MNIIKSPSMLHFVLLPFCLLYMVSCSENKLPLDENVYVGAWVVSSSSLLDNVGETREERRTLSFMKDRTFEGYFIDSDGLYFGSGYWELAGKKKISLNFMKKSGKEARFNKTFEMWKGGVLRDVWHFDEETFYRKRQ